MPNVTLETTSTAARRIKVSESTIRRLIREGVLPVTRTATGIALIAPEDLEQLALTRARRQHTESFTPSSRRAS